MRLYPSVIAKHTACCIFDTCDLTILLLCCGKLLKNYKKLCKKVLTQAFLGGMMVLAFE